VRALSELRRLRTANVIKIQHADLFQIFDLPPTPWSNSCASSYPLPDLALLIYLTGFALPSLNSPNLLHNPVGDHWSPGLLGFDPCCPYRPNRRVDCPHPRGDCNSSTSKLQGARDKCTSAFQFQLEGGHVDLQHISLECNILDLYFKAISKSATSRSSKGPVQEVRTVFFSEPRTC
jgi:hypothetical protein